MAKRNEPTGMVVCPTCKGKPYLDAFSQKEDAPCPMCNGGGRVFASMCKCCGQPMTQPDGTCGRVVTQGTNYTARHGWETDYGYCS